jgi:hypothetical protein
MTTITESNISFKNQFNLVKGGDKSDSFMKNNYSFLTEPSTYGLEEVSVQNMHPFNYMDKFKNKNMQHMTNRRDNTLIINDYHTNEVGQYAKKKTALPNLFEPVVNLNALAGDTKIVDKISLDRFSSTLQYKSNEYPDDTYVRAEQIDGTPMTEIVRPREKSLEQLRGEGVNSIRLAPEGRNNETAGTIAGGVSTDPKSINITKYKMKSYREQNTVDDLLKTTGQITRPEWRSMVKQTDSERSFMPAIDGPPVASVMRQSYHNNQSAKPTNRTDYEDNNYVGGVVSAVGGSETYRNEQSARPTNRTEYEDNNYVGGVVSAVGGKSEFRNEQSMRPTIRADYENNTNINNPVALVSQSSYRNQQSANPTIRTDYENNINIINPVSLVSQSGYRNEQSAHPTIRTDYENNTNIINPVSLVSQTGYRNEQSANPTIRTDYENNTNIINPVSLVSQSGYRNEQSAHPTIRTDYENNTFTGSGFNNTAGYVYENNQSAKPTNRTDYENNKFTGSGYNDNAGYVYENNQSAKPTNRTDYENNQFTGSGFNNSAGQLYENNQSANPTLREADNEFVGIGFNQTNSQYKKYDDITRSGVVEEVLAKDYMGAEISFVPRSEDRTNAINMIQNQSVEDSINLTNRDLMGGGTDRIPQGRENIGIYNDWNRREKNPPITNRVRNVAVNYIQEIPDTRGYNLLQERSNINQYVPETLSNNPFISNVVYSTNTERDIIRENTIINDRNNNRE